MLQFDDKSGMTITTGKMELLTRLLDVAAMRQDVTAQNVANVNTPGYGLLEVSFEDSLRDALSSPDWRERLASVTAEVVPSDKPAERLDGNNVDIDLEMARVQKNGLFFQAYTQMLANELAQFRAAITGVRLWGCRGGFMAFDDLMVSGNISASGMSAERLRMEVIANNVANAMATRSPSGGPYRRQDVVFEAVLREATYDSPTAMLGGVHVAGIEDDQSELPRVFNPGHPDADSDGFVSMPNVFLPIEMVNLMTASRAYEANLRVLQTLRQQMEQSLTLLR